ncbi:unnamed protein product, partial [Notodromas monacha]
MTEVELMQDMPQQSHHQSIKCDVKQVCDQEDQVNACPIDSGSKLEIPSIVVQAGQSPPSSPRDPSPLVQHQQSIGMQSSSTPPSSRVMSPGRSHPPNRSLHQKGLIKQRGVTVDEEDWSWNQPEEYPTMATTLRAMSLDCDAHSHNANEPPKPSSPDPDSNQHLHHSCDSLRTRPKPRNSKMRLLVRSAAMREATSPPPEVNHSSWCQHELPHKSNFRGHKFRQGSSQSAGSINDSLPSLSRDNSVEQYKDFAGMSSQELEDFIAETLHRSPKDRTTLLKIEAELVSFARDEARSSYKFPPMSSYQRMLVHRVAAYFGMAHNIDAGGTSVVVERTKSTRVPDMKFRDQIQPEVPWTCPHFDPTRAVLKKDSGGSLDDYKLSSSAADLNKQWSESTESSSEGVTPAHPHPPPPRPFKVASVDSDPLLAPPSSSSAEKRTGTMAKANSFGGYSSQQRYSARLISKQDSVGSSTNSYLSASSGYKSYRGTSIETRTPSLGSGLLYLSANAQTQTHSLSSQGPSPDIPECIHETPGPQAGEEDEYEPEVARAMGIPDPDLDGNSQTQPVVLPGVIVTSTNTANNLVSQWTGVLWALSSLDEVPAGAILINPQTGKPLVNTDGSIYKFDKMNPPQVIAATAGPQAVALGPAQQVVTHLQPIAPAGHQSAAMSQHIMEPMAAYAAVPSGTHHVQHHQQMYSGYQTGAAAAAAAAAALGHHALLAYAHPQQQQRQPVPSYHHLPTANTPGPGNSMLPQSGSVSARPLQLDNTAAA